jgi:hypothetical protein
VAVDDQVDRAGRVVEQLRAELDEPGAGKAAGVGGEPQQGSVALTEGRLRKAGLMPRRLASPAPRSSFAGFRFPPEVIMLAVRWYLRYGLSYRDVAELLAERGITVDHVTIYRWVQRFTPELLDAARPSRHVAADRWFVDETYLKVAGQWVYLYRAIDQHGQVIDVLASPKRDLAATRQFFALRGSITQSLALICGFRLRVRTR